LVSQICCIPHHINCTLIGWINENWIF
jgi:hypothetical protein